MAVKVGVSQDLVGGACDKQRSAAHTAPIGRSLGHSLTVGLVTHAQYDFRGARVAGHHVRGHQESRGCCPGQSKVQDLQRAVRLYHNVARFQILRLGDRRGIRF